jgi:murein DD-endopeptidase MepM/ murein hydrolase activator NlpD
MTQLAWPLQRNIMRRQVPNHTFGKVRNAGTKDHQGWDLYALPMTPCYAIADGKIALIRDSGPAGYGRHIVLEFEYGDRKLYAAYCHLSVVLVQKGETVVRSQAIACTGSTGNASTMRGEDHHLHFEIRTEAVPPGGMAGRVDPASLYGRAPVNMMFVQGHGAKPPAEGVTGLRVPGVNVLP